MSDIVPVPNGHRSPSGWTNTFAEAHRPRRKTVREARAGFIADARRSTLEVV